MNNAGRQPFNNRVGWAQTYLKKAGLLEAPRRVLYRITSRGLDVLSQKPDVITLNILLQYPEFVEFRSRNSGEERDSARDPFANEKFTPDELLETGYRQMMQTLADDLLVKVKSCSPDFFERLVVEWAKMLDRPVDIVHRLRPAERRKTRIH